MRYFNDEDDQKEDEEDGQNCAEVNDEDEDGQVEQEDGEAMKLEEDADDQGQRREDDKTKPSQETAAMVGKGLEEQPKQAGSDSPPPGSTDLQGRGLYSATVITE